jgi:hypothetical protein
LGEKPPTPIISALQISHVFFGGARVKQKKEKQRSVNELGGCFKITIPEETIEPVKKPGGRISVY